MKRSPRLTRFVLAATLTVSCAAGAGVSGVLTVQPAYADGCANTECEGVIACRYMKGIVCSYPDRYSCLNTRCQAADN